MAIPLIVVPGTFGKEGNLGLLQNIVDLIQPDTFEVETIAYPASMLFPCSYLRSTAVGIARLNLRLRELEAAGQEYAILGYSQGAEVAARTLARHPERFMNLRGAVLLASPVRLSRTSPRGGILGAITENVPEWMSARILEVSNPADIVAASNDGSFISRLARVITRMGGSNYRHQEQDFVKKPSRFGHFMDAAATQSRKALFFFPGLAAHVSYDTAHPDGTEVTYTQLAANYMLQFAVA